MIRRPPRSTLSSSSAASDVYKRQLLGGDLVVLVVTLKEAVLQLAELADVETVHVVYVGEETTGVGDACVETEVAVFGVAGATEGEAHLDALDVTTADGVISDGLVLVDKERTSRVDYVSSGLAGIDGAEEELPLELGGTLDIGKGLAGLDALIAGDNTCLLYTSPSPRDRTRSRMPSSA
eukprot:TRINITY_DN40951_c0_g1_i4.p1 TRINITY_DN40951_c0_g1~~TRINITY_DN40951_c0_g1_i4.p1  ORF type:complete len:180 (-),score=26.09 TRINITY_DN40951_c0_g1_i4:17-556(-)